MPRTPHRLFATALLAVSVATAGLTAGPAGALGPTTVSLPPADQPQPPDTDLAVADAYNYAVREVHADGSDTKTLVDTADIVYTLTADAANNIYFVAGNVVYERRAAGGDPVVLATLATGTLPYGIAVNKTGAVFVSSFYDDLVYKIPAGGGPATTFASGVHGPLQIGVDASDNLYVLTQRSDLVEYPAGSTTGTTIAPTTETAFGLAVQPDGSFYVGDFYAGTRHYSSGSVADTRTYETVPEVPTHVIGLAVDRAGNLYATVLETGTVFELPADGSGLRTVADELNRPFAAVPLDEPLPVTPPVTTPTVPGQPTSPVVPHLQTTRAPHLRGHQMSIEVTGFTPGETYVVKISGVIVGHGTVSPTGSIVRKVRVPLRAHRPRAKLVVKSPGHRVHTLIRVRNGIAKH